MPITMPPATPALPVSSTSASQNEGTSIDLSLRDQITQKMSGYLVELGLMSEEDRSKDHVLTNLLRDPNFISKMGEIQKEALEGRLEKKKEDAVTYFNELGQLLPWSRHDKIINQIKNQLDNNNNVSNLNASALGLTSLPNHPSVLLSLNELDLSGNQFRTIPSVIAALTNLTSLDLSKNDLGTLYIPSTFPSSPEAYELVALQNASTGTEHDVARIEELKQQLGNILGTEHTLSSLAALKELNLSGNRALGSLGYNLFPAGLERLDVSNTGITHLPVSLFQDFPKGLPEGLKEINIIGCKKIEEIELTLMPKNLTIIHDGNTRFLVNGEEFNSEEFSENEWNIKMQKKVVSDIPEYI